MSLADHYKPGGGHLQAGVHEVEVMGVRKIASKSDTPGVEFQMEAVDGTGYCKAAFWLTDAAYQVLAGFAAACGLSKEDMAAYNPIPPNMDGHKMLVGNCLKVRVVKSGEYHEIDDFGWYPLSANVIDRSAEMPSSTQEHTPPTDTPF